MKKRLVVLISGSGSNLQALIDVCNSHSLNAEIVAVFSNKADAYGLTRLRMPEFPLSHSARRISLHGMISMPHYRVRLMNTALMSLFSPDICGF